MGYKTIEAHKKELEKNLIEHEKFLAIAGQINGGLKEMADLQKKFKDDLKALQQQTAGLNTFGIAAYEAYKKSLTAICADNSTSFRPLPTKPIEDYMYQQREALWKETDAWVLKKMAAFPKNITVGMTFRENKTGHIGEVVKPPTPTGKLLLPAKTPIMAVMLHVHFAGKDMGNHQVTTNDLTLKWKYLHV